MTSTRTRLIRLLDRGFYPAELPPPFKTKHFSAVMQTLAPPINYVGSTTFFDGSTFRGTLRTFGTINPISYYLLSKFIAESWSDITEVYKLSGCSGARPKFPSLGKEGRAIEAASLAAKRMSQRHLASVFPIVLSLDVNRFYGSIYSHSIPWAALGKQEAKRRHRARTLAGHWSDRLDTLVRNCNQQQTVGIAIGPDTSRILSELILSRIDSEIASPGSGLANPQIYHNIDDYQIGTFGISDAENAKSCFLRTLSRYELRLNDFKTSIDHGLDFAPSNFQRHFDVLRGQTGRNFVEHFFEILYAQISRHPDTNVVGYALKRFAKLLARNHEQALVKEYLQRLIFAAPHQARWLLPLLLGIYRHTGLNLEIRRLLEWGIETCIRRNDVGSLLWFLYAAMFLRILLPKALCEQCVGISNELVDLMLYHGRQLGLFRFNLEGLRQRYLGSDLDSSAWLPIYEISRRGWDLTAAFNKIGRPEDRSSLYAHLRANDVEFYSIDPNAFEVTAFDNWNLIQDDFQGHQEYEHDFDVFDIRTEWEEYE